MFIWQPGWTRLVKTFTTTFAQSEIHGEMSIQYNDSALTMFITVSTCN